MVPAIIQVGRPSGLVGEGGTLTSMTYSEISDPGATMMNEVARDETC